MLRILHWIFVAVALVIFSAGVAIWLFWDEPLHSPVTDQSAFRFLLDLQPRHARADVVYGFLPYWNAYDTELQPEVTHIGYFGLAIGPDGTLETRDGNGQTPGFTALQSEELLSLAGQIEARGGRMELVVTQFYGEDTVAFITSESAQTKFLETLDALILAYPITGLNLDIEPSGIEYTPELRNKFTAFVTRVRTHLNSKYDNIPLSIDVYASASNNKQLWDIPALSQQVDYIIVMAYDYHRRGSAQAGPVAPIFSSNGIWSEDINSHLKDFLSLAPAEKFILGIPFYGYGWQTTDKSATANTYPESGFTATIDTVREILENKKVNGAVEHWNDQALAPYLSYTENEETYIVYYENPRSIAYKLDLVRELGLSGIAIWAIGYESGERALWDVIDQKI